jgi:ribose-phosphate pyrophosphokinase
MSRNQHQNQINKSCTMREGSLKIFTGNSNPALAQEICDTIKVPLGDATVKLFPDGETRVKINENIRGSDVYMIQSTCKPANHHIMELLIMIDAARRASASRITAVIPFFGYARQDRKDQPRVPITAKLVANLLTAAGVDRVLAMDLHAQQIQGFFDIPVDHLFASSVLFDHLREYRTKNDFMVFAPDVGGMKMAASYADMYNCPLGFVAKRRTSATSVEAFNLIGDVKGFDVILVDDMTETAGTINAASKLLKENGARSVVAAVSHCMLNEMAYDRLAEGYLDELVTTNSVPIETRGLPITVKSVAPLFGEAIMRIHDNKSVTGLFQVKGF